MDRKQPFESRKSDALNAMMVFFLQSYQSHMRVERARLFYMAKVAY